MKTIDMLIDGGIIVTMDRERRIIDGGSVAIEGDKIVDIGIASELKRNYDAKKVIRADKMLVLPGLINSHTHARHALWRGLDDSMNLERALLKIYSPLQQAEALSPRNTYLGTLLSCLAYIRTGTTCFGDHDIQAPEVARAVEKAGIRCVISPWMEDTPPPLPGIKPPVREEIVNEAVDFFKSWNGKAEGRIRCWFGPLHELGASEQLLKDIISVADQYKTGIHLHLAETLRQRDTIKKNYGKSSIEYGYDLGLLRKGTVVAHCCWLSPHDITLLANSGASVAHCPTSEMRLSDGVTPIPYLLEAGVNVTLGTDGAGGDSESNDLIQEMKIAALLHKVGYPLSPDTMTAEKVLEMVTVNGAKAILWDTEIGSLEKGKKADVILVNMTKPQLVPIIRRPKFNVVNLLVYSAVGDDVDTMIVNGKIIMENRRILTVHEGAILEEVQAAVEEFLKVGRVDQQVLPWRWSI